jgi:hypothetical protein
LAFHRLFSLLDINLIVKHLQYQGSEFLTRLGITDSPPHIASPGGGNGDGRRGVAESLGLEQYEAAFRENDVDAEVCPR